MHTGRVIFGAMEQSGWNAAGVPDHFMRRPGLPRSPQDLRINPDCFDRIVQMAMAMLPDILRPAS